MERLEFLDVLLGDRPPLTVTEGFYQRLLAGDADEALEHAERYLEDHAISEFFDDVAMPALAMARQDIRRGMLDRPRQEIVRDTVRTLLDELHDYEDVSPQAAIAEDTTHTALAPVPERRRSIAPILSAEDVAPQWQDRSAILGHLGTRSHR